jgi:diacylglycerol kinase
MIKEMAKEHHPVKHVKRFKYAFNGIFHALINEANFRIQVLYTIVVIYAGIYFSISHTDWALIVLSLGFLLSAEMVNTAVENVIDHVTHHYDESARIIKDLSAGFVLVTAICTLLVGIIVFSPYITLYF